MNFLLSFPAFSSYDEIKGTTLIEHRVNSVDLYYRLADSIIASNQFTSKCRY